MSSGLEAPANKEAWTVHQHLGWYVVCDARGKYVDAAATLEQAEEFARGVAEQRCVQIAIKEVPGEQQSKTGTAKRKNT